MKYSAPLAGIIFFSALSLAAPVGAQQSDAGELLARAIDDYGRALDTEERDQRLESFHRAEMLFERVIESGASSPGLYTNLANAALQAERLGQAVLGYRRALLLDPDHPREVQNLAHARALLPDWVPRPEPAGVLDSFFFWHRTIPFEREGVRVSFAFDVIPA